LLYNSPEQLTKSTYTNYVDTWAVGIIQFMLFSMGVHPYYESSDLQHTIENSYLKKLF